MLMVTKEELIAQLEQHLEDEQLIELIEKAEESDDPVAVLQSAMDDVSRPDEPLTPDADLEGVEIVPVLVRVIDPNTHEPTNMITGFELQRNVAGVKLYAGKTLDWGPRYRSIPFANEQEAKAAAAVWINEEKKRVKILPMRRQFVSFHIPHGLPVKKSGIQFSIRLTVEETHKMDCLLYGLRACNIELEPNMPVDSYPDILRWFLKQFTAA